jgi:hypothetical protein
MRKILISLLLLVLVGCSKIFQYSKPNIVEVDSIDQVPTACQPIFLNAPDAMGEYYMEIKFTNDLPEFGWLAVETGTLVYEVVPAYPKPMIKKIVGIAKEPAYIIVDKTVDNVESIKTYQPATHTIKN